MNLVDTSKLKSDGGPYSQSLSNMAESELLSNNEINTGVSVYPTLASSYVIITNAEIEIFNVLGVEVYSKFNQDRSIKINCSLWAKGVYRVNILRQDKNYSVNIGVE